MESGESPFRYLRVSLHSKKPNALDCRNLVEKITAKIKTWSAKLLSYARRVELVGSVIRGLQNL